MARKKGSPNKGNGSDLRTAQINIRLTPAQLRIIKEAAAKRREPLTRFVLRAVLNELLSGYFPGGPIDRDIVAMYFED